MLGEQVFSALRAKRTEDLIFAGGDGRPRAGMAEVYLTLDNSDGFFPIDFNEVVVGRRAYRDGENEYLLNGSKVRLRDVSELLAKTGLARRTYTVIGQGMVDQALAINSDERRALFEEAAGISLYRHKREDALKKLDETRRNLERVRDIVAEIGPRVRSTGTAGAARARLRAPLRRTARHASALVRLSLGQRSGGAAAKPKKSSKRRPPCSPRAAPRWAATTIGLRRSASSSSICARRSANGIAPRADCTRRPKRLQRQLAVLEERARSLQQQIDQTQSDQAALETQLAAQADRVTAAEAELNGIVARYETQAAAIAAAQAALAERQTQRQSIATIAHRSADGDSKSRTRAGRSPQSTSAVGRAPHRAWSKMSPRTTPRSTAQQQQQAEIETQRAALDADLARLKHSARIC